MSQILPLAPETGTVKDICSGLFNDIQVILNAYCNIFVTIMITIIK